MSDCVVPLPHRREMLRHGAALAALIAVGLAGGRQARAAGVESAFGAESMQDALRALGGIPASNLEIELAVPDLVENGAYVPVTVDCRLPGTREIFIVVEANPNPLAASFTIAPGTEPFVSMRIKMAGTCHVHAVVRADGKLYSASKQTQVMVGGCG